MPNAKLILAFGLAAVAAAGCSKQQQATDQNISIDAGVPDNEMAGNADIVALPPDESSTTPTNQLQNGFDAPDVNDSGNAGNSY
jgi:hypothetical protein